MPINENAELAKAALDRLYFDVVFFVQLGRHTGGHQLLDGSYQTVVDCYFSHGFVMRANSFGRHDAKLYHTVLIERMVERTKTMPYSRFQISD